jgi:tRNA(Met) cytidine acetyltransferase
MLLSDNHRHCFLLTGSIYDVLSDFFRLSKHLSTPLICAHDVAPYDKQNLPSLTKKPFRTCSFKQARQELGSTHDAILVDLTHGVSASALAILAGTVRGNGVFAIALPKGDWLSVVDLDLPRYLPWPFESHQIDSSFKRYLLNQLHGRFSPFQTLASDQIHPLPALPLMESLATLTEEQTEAQSCLFEEKAKSYVLIAPRGRGKSTLLGDSLAKMLKAGKKVALTAPNQDAIKTLKARFEQILKEVDLDAELPFFAPDALLANPTHWDTLFVDEASMIPVPLLMALNQKADHCLFSTTDYGYEGAGKGFGIRFCRYLAAQPTILNTAFLPLTLSEPIRWGGNDPLENWTNACFFLAPNQDAILNEASTSSLPPTYKAIANKAWLDQPDLLARTFQLLVSAHYQTSPDNLRWILDDPSVFAYLSLQGSAVRCVAIMTAEGQLPDALSLAVLQGTRRPRGHLIPQSLLAHEGIEDAGRYRYWRISRIATQQSEQNKGLASQLLDQIEIAAQEQCDFLSTSFAATPDVVSFWLKNGFIPVRLGTTKDQASGCYSLMMVKPLNEMARQKTLIWHQDYRANLAINLPRDYQDIDADLTSTLSADFLAAKPLTDELTDKDKQDLALFVNYHRPYLTIRAQLTRLVNTQLARHQLSRSHPHFSLLNTVITQPAHEIDFVTFGLKTKKHVEKHLKGIVRELLLANL